MNVQEFLADYGSTTKHFKSWSDDYRLEVLKHGFFENYFQRVVAIFVDKTPVLLGVSEVDDNSPLFLDILQNSGTTPIGLQLFKQGTDIKRTQLQIGETDTKLISNKAVQEYFADSGIHGNILYRQSSFIKDTQSMLLKEYVLPGLYTLLKAKS